MPFLKLTSDFLFKTLFSQNPDLLAYLVNSALGKAQVSSVKIINPAIPKEILSDKLSVLDIKAKDQYNNIFHIEMQASPQDFYTKRAIYYWAKLYFRQLNQGNLYSDLKKVYSISFLNFSGIPHSKRYHFTFLTLDKYDPKIRLTDDFEVHILEIPRFKKTLEELESSLDRWLYVIKRSSRLKEKEMEAIIEKNPIMEKTFSELERISMDEKTRELYEMREIGLHDYNTNIQSAFERGEKRGIRKGQKREHKRTIRNTAIKLRSSGMSLEFMSQITELSIPWLKKFFEKIEKSSSKNGA
ncbi:MAG: PD-(D/E)XK nuclease family transposase [Leptospiraceae bacterium]|nr:PD-(D/E)XK nuclease family transposase [Leptospiraceae bacterium]